MSAQGIAAAIGGLFCLFVLIGFVRSIWHKLPDRPGSNDAFGGMPPGSIGNHDIGPGDHGT
jgi:hypothetical protein